jgi:hypothetical protein
LLLRREIIIAPIKLITARDPNTETSAKLEELHLLELRPASEGFAVLVGVFVAHGLPPGEEVLVGSSVKMDSMITVDSETIVVGYEKLVLKIKVVDSLEIILVVDSDTVNVAVSIVVLLFE